MPEAFPRDRATGHYWNSTSRELVASISPIVAHASAPSYKSQAGRLRGFSDDGIRRFRRIQTIAPKMPDRIAMAMTVPTMA
jgi:hypothetical protein